MNFFNEFFYIGIQVILMIIGQWMALKLTQKQTWFEKSPLLRAEGENCLSYANCGSYENYSVFSISSFQYLSLFLIFGQRIWANCYLSLILTAMTVASIIIVLQPLDHFHVWMQMRMPPMFNFRLELVALALLYLMVSLAVQYLIRVLSSATSSTSTTSIMATTSTTTASTDQRIDGASGSRNSAPV